MYNIEPLEERLGIKFRDHLLLMSAITHRSYLAETQRHPVPHNERLEFLGDAVLELAIREHLYLHHHASEGEMTRVEGLIVNRKYLGQVARSMGLGSFILTSRGLPKDGERAYSVVLGNCLEAIIGAIYFDKGYRVCQEFISRTLLVNLPELIKDPGTNPKSHLQEEVQDVLGETPTYRIVDKIGPEHGTEWVCAVFAGPLELGRGKGLSKKEAEQKAAQDALEKGLYCT